MKKQSAAGAKPKREQRADPLSLVTLKSRWILPTRLVFDVVVKDDVISVRFSRLPQSGMPWYASYESRHYRSGMVPLEGVKGGRYAEPMAIAEKLCSAIGAPAPRRIRNLETNFVDVVVPELMMRGPLRVNHPFRPSGHLRTNACVLFADLRGFSSWSLKAEDEDILDVANAMLNFVKQGASDYRFDYWKLLGDGILLVWDALDDGALRADQALEAAFELHKKYWYFRKGVSFEIQTGFGIAVTGGPVTKFWSKDWLDLLMIVDYLGPIVNQAARMQGIAAPGEVLVDTRIRQASSDDWYAFGDVSENQQSELKKAKGTRRAERIYVAKHTAFGSTWKNFCEPNR